MKKLFLYFIICFFILFYFFLTVYVFPEFYLSKDLLVSQPHLEVSVSEFEISLGDSFDLTIFSENRGDYGDIHIVSVGFPNLIEIDGDVVQITSYDFSQSSVYLLPGENISLDYSLGVTSTVAQYPSIEAMNRPVFPDSENHLTMSITPELPGPFTVYIKAINVPHVANVTHFPQFGILDQQREHVLVYSINVIP